MSFNNIVRVLYRRTRLKRFKRLKPLNEKNNIKQESRFIMSGFLSIDKFLN